MTHNLICNKKVTYCAFQRPDLSLEKGVKLRLAMTKFLMALGLFFVMAFACAAQQSQTSTAGEQMNHGILQGTVTIGPLRPGPQRETDTGTAPPELFASHKVIILSAADRSRVKEAQPGAKGSYRVELPPGKYLVDFEPHDIGVPRMKKAPLPEVTIRAGESTTFDLSIDTGMR